MPQETKKMRIILDRLNDLVRDYCMLNAASEFLQKEEKAKSQLGKKLLNAFLDEYPESELAELLQELTLMTDKFEFFERFYTEPETVEWEVALKKQQADMEAAMEAAMYEDEFPDIWL